MSRTRPTRFNQQGIGALYVALSPAVALEELKRRAAKADISVTTFDPRVLFDLEVRLEKVLDLTHPGIREEWGTTLEDLRTEDDYDRCREVGVAARDEGFEAIRFPSATGDGENLAIFFDRLRATSYVRIVAETPVDLEQL